MNVGLQETTDAFEQHRDKAETPKPSEFAHDLGRGPCGLLSVSNADQRCHTSRHAVPKGTFSNVRRRFWSSRLGLLLACREEAKLNTLQSTGQNYPAPNVRSVEAERLWFGRKTILLGLRPL